MNRRQASYRNLKPFGLKTFDFELDKLVTNTRIFNPHKINLKYMFKIVFHVDYIKFDYDVRLILKICI